MLHFPLSLISRFNKIKFAVFKLNFFYFVTVVPHVSWCCLEKGLLTAGDPL